LSQLHLEALCFTIHQSFYVAGPVWGSFVHKGLEPTTFFAAPVRSSFAHKKVLSQLLLEVLFFHPQR
jgi:hypothetical protein